MLPNVQKEYSVNVHYKVVMLLSTSHNKYPYDITHTFESEMHAQIYISSDMGNILTRYNGDKLQTDSGHEYRIFDIQLIYDIYICYMYYNDNHSLYQIQI